jgi:hypothetical protein
MKSRFYIYSAMLVLLGFGIGANASTTIYVPTPPPGISNLVDTPTGVKVSIGYKKIIVSWDPVSTPIRYYRVESTWEGASKWYGGPVTTKTSISLNLPTKNILVTYHVVAVGYKGLSLPSESASIIVK